MNEPVTNKISEAIAPQLASIWARSEEHPKEYSFKLSLSDRETTALLATDDHGEPLWLRIDDLFVTYSALDNDAKANFDLALQSENDKFSSFFTATGFRFDFKEDNWITDRRVHGISRATWPESWSNLDWDQAVEIVTHCIRSAAELGMLKNGDHTFDISSPRFYIFALEKVDEVYKPEILENLNVSLYIFDVGLCQETIQSICFLMGKMDQQTQDVLADLVGDIQKTNYQTWEFVRHINSTEDLYRLRPLIIRSIVGFEDLPEDFNTHLLSLLGANPELCKDIYFSVQGHRSDLLLGHLGISLTIEDFELNESNIDPRDIIEYPEAFKTIPEERLYREACKDYRAFNSALPADSPLHKYYDPDGMFKTLLNQEGAGKWNAAEKILSRGIRGLSAGIAMKLIDEGLSIVLISHIDQFVLNKKEMREILAHVLATEDISTLIEHLDRFSPSLLEPFEARHHFLQYKRDLGIPSGVVYERYLELLNRSNPDAFIDFVSRLRNFDNEFVTSERYDDEFLDDEYYKEVIRLRFKNEGFAKFEVSEKCPDRSQDMDKYDSESRTVEVEVNSGANWVLKEGENVDLALRDSLERSFATCSLIFEDAKEEEKLAAFCKAFAGKDSPAITDYAEVLVERFLNAKKRPQEHDKMILSLIAYHYATSLNFESYAQGTTDRSTKASSPDYLSLIYYREFFSDRMQDTLNALVDEISARDDLALKLNAFAKENTEDYRPRIIKDLSGRPLGITAQFKKELQKIEDNQALSEEKRQEIISQRLERERQRIVSAFAQYGIVVPIEEVNLDEYSTEQYVKAYYKGSAATDCAAQLLNEIKDIFLNHVVNIDCELAKYRTEDTRIKKVYSLTMHIAKNRAAAHALRAAAVCLAGDVPEETGLLSEVCLWNMENFSVDIIKDKSTNQGLGANLLHEFEDNGNLTLVVSLHPSATFLYRVDADELYHTLVHRLIKFAEENDFDYLLLPKDKQIRTNRTGGSFEVAMDRDVEKKNETYHFAEPKKYSFDPAYVIQECDVLWKRGN